MARVGEEIRHHRTHRTRRRGRHRHRPRHGRAPGRVGASRRPHGPPRGRARHRREADPRRHRRGGRRGRADVSAPDPPRSVDRRARRARPQRGRTAPGRILQVTDEQWEQAFALLVTGPLRLARRAVPGMAERGFGRVVFVTSVMVRQPQPDLAASVVLRSATTAAAKLLSRECADRGVTVNCVAPGATATDRRQEILEARAGGHGRHYADAGGGRRRRRARRARRAAGRDRRRGRLPGLGRGELRQRHGDDGGRTDGRSEVRKRSGPAREGHVQGRGPVMASRGRTSRWASSSARSRTRCGRARRARSSCTPTSWRRSPRTRCTTRAISPSRAGCRPRRSRSSGRRSRPGPARTCSATTTRPCTT